MNQHSPRWNLRMQNTWMCLLTPFALAPNFNTASKENVVVTWDLRRRGSAELKRSVQATMLVGSGKGKIGRECVFHLRLSLSNHWSSVIFFFKLARWGRTLDSWPIKTHSLCVLPRSLSHQFSFNTLDKGYPTLLRRYQLDITGAKLETRKTIEISP